MVRRPAVFLMDEPLSNLDARLRLTMRGEIKRLCQRLGATTLYVTHDQAEALTMADLIAVMKDGELQQIAPPAEIYDRPANRFVATFVGSPAMSVLPAGLDDAGLHVGDALLHLDAGRQQDCRATAAEAIGIRPEDVSLADPGTPGAIGAEVYGVEPMGNETLVDVRVKGERLTLRARRGFTAPIGSTVGVTFDPANACFFDKAGNTVVHRAPNKGDRS
jgi:multiple sugar transport system ATP-binding protein